MHPPNRRMQAVVLFGNLIFSFGIAITAYVNSSFIERIVGERGVGVLYAIAAVIIICILTAAPRTLSRIGNRRFFLSYAAINALALAVLVLPAASTVLSILAFVTYLVSGSAIVFSFNVFFEHVTEAKTRGKMRGLFLLLANAGWMLAPIMTARIIDRYAYSGLYMLSLIILAVVVLFMHAGTKRYRDPHYAIHREGLGFFRALRKKHLRHVIIANFILQFFYSWMVIYAPIYLSTHLGFSWDQIGLMFSVMLSAFVVLDYPLGWIADRLGSEKEFTAIGFVIMATSVFGLAFIPSVSLLTIGGLLLLSRVGAATVETMTEIHFFKIASDAEPELLAVLSDMPPLSNIVAPLIGILIITFCPFKTIFAVLGFILLIGCYHAAHLENTKKWWSRAHRR